MPKLIAEKFEFRGVTYESRWVKCNKPTCEQCPHGPYWYAVVHLFDKKPVTRYIGKNLAGPALKYYQDEFTGEVTKNDQ